MKNIQQYITGIKKICYTSGTIILAIFICSIFVNPEYSLDAILKITSFKSYMIPKIIAGIFLSLKYKIIMQKLIIYPIDFLWMQLLDIIYFLSGSTVVPSDCIDEVPKSELLDFLFTEKSFKREDVELAFRIPRYKVTDLKKNLERVGVLVRGECNAHILNEDYTRRDIASMIEGVNKSEQLQPLFRKRSNGSFTSEPSAKELKERLSQSLLPCAEDVGFKTRVLA